MKVIALYCIALHCFALHFIELYYIVLYCIVTQTFVTLPPKQKIPIYSRNIWQSYDSYFTCSKVNVFTFGGAKRGGSDRECKYFPIGMNAREPLWR